MAHPGKRSSRGHREGVPMPQGILSHQTGVLPGVPAVAELGAVGVRIGRLFGAQMLCVRSGPWRPYLLSRLSSHHSECP